MKLIDNAREVLAKAWSVRLATLATLFALIDLVNQLLPFVSPFVPSETFSALAAICGALAVLARFIRQQNLKGEP